MSARIDPVSGKIWTRERLITIAAGVVVIVALGFGSYRIGERSSATTVAPPKPATNAAPVSAAPAPAPLAALPAQISSAPLKAARGSAFKIGDFSGKVMLINLWATWCGPCRRETPELVKLHQEFKDRGVEVIGLSTEDPNTSAEAVRKFVEQFQVDYRIGWIPDEMASTLMQGRDSIPQSFIIARDGRILNHFVGFSQANTSNQLRAALEEALKDKS